MIIEEVNRAVEVLRRGGIILYPTDTVWGIGCDATNAEAVERIYRLKGSVNKKGMIVLVDTPANVGRYIRRVPEVAYDLMELTDKPLTLILDGAVGVAENLIPEEGSLAVRVPDHEFCRLAVGRLRRPIVSTSANLSGEATPTRFGEIVEAIKEGVDMVVDPRWEGNPTRKASSIMMIKEDGEFKILR
ncbi:MAG: threonylcarbamoyl-AMP synthase [Tidjanibacter sp.]|nr:threonylcarbamoyl-AMP synthase [Tidjanibacter sp.]